jgi:hypothetical protein
MKNSSFLSIQVRFDHQTRGRDKEGGRGRVWILLSGGVHVSETTSQTPRLSNVNGFNSRVVKNSYF